MIHPQYRVGAALLSLLILAGVLGPTGLSRGYTKAPPGMECIGIDRPWEASEIVGEVLVLDSPSPRLRNHLVGYRLPTLTKLWDRDGGGRVAARGRALFHRGWNKDLERLDPATGRRLYLIGNAFPGGPRRTELLEDTIVMDYGRLGQIGYRASDGKEIWRASSTCPDVATTYGVAPGSMDLVGWRPVGRYEPAMRAPRSACFSSNPAASSPGAGCDGRVII